MDEFNRNRNEVPHILSGLEKSTTPPPPNGSGRAEMPQKSKFWKFAGWFAVIVIVAIVALWFIGDYQWRKGIENFEKWVESTKQAAADFEARKAADTYGGATPQETLRLYIEAVERGDYELASKYFVLDRQEVELESWKSSDITTESVERLLSVLRGLQLEDKERWIKEMYESDVRQYNISEPYDDYRMRIGEIYEGRAWMSTKVDGYDFSVEFRRYPSGIWKIVEI